MTTPLDPRARAAERASFVLAGGFLLAVLVWHLVPALLAGLLAYELIQVLEPRLRIAQMRRRVARLIAVGLLAVVVIGLIVLAIVGIAAFVHSDAGSLQNLFQKMADIIEGVRARLPASVLDRVPADIVQLREAVVAWLRENSGVVGHAGATLGRGFVHILIGLVIGALVNLHEAGSPDSLGPLARALQARAERLGEAFRRVVFGQIRISGVNTVLTGLYLAVALPIAGVHLPLTKTMIVVTFCTGLLPVIGNLISNTVIVIVSLSVSLPVAISSLIFLVVIHKLEYFLNAQIIGHQVRAHAWELLVAMVVMEAAFGVPGLIAAPIYYACLKDELVRQKLV